MKTLLLSITLLIAIACCAQDSTGGIQYRKADKRGLLFADDTVKPVTISIVSSSIDKRIYHEHFLMSNIIRAMSPSGHINWRDGFVAAWKAWRQYLIDESKK